jgi:tRNA modification GTPase
VEQEGVRRAWAEIEQADRLLLLLDDQCRDDDHLDIEDRMPKHIGITRVFNKIDLSGRDPAVTETPRGTQIALSAKTGAGLDLLRQHLKTCMGYEQASEGRFSARRRHLDALEQARQHLTLARYNLEELQAGELLAEELRQAQEALNQITGEFTSDDLLGRIFSSFCIGK